MLDAGPFTSWTIDIGANVEIRTVSFSDDDKLLLVTTNSNVVCIVDAFEGTVVRKWTSRLNSRGATLEACFTPDSQFVLGGSEDGTVHCWSVEETEPVHIFTGHAAPVSSVRWNPRLMTFASACMNTVLWLPKDVKTIE